MPKTQSAIALSSAEGELSAIGTRAGEALRARTFLLETKLLDKLNIVVKTDPSSGNTTATTVGTTKKTVISGAYTSRGADRDDFYSTSSGAWIDTLHKYWSGKKVVGEAFSFPISRRGARARL